MINRATICTALVACTGLLLSANAYAAFTEIKPNTVKINGTKYWRAKADEAKIGSLGVKRAPVGSAYFYEKMQNAPNGIYKITVGDPYIISSEQAMELGVSGSASNGAVTGSASGEVSKNNSANMSIYKLSIDLGNKKGNLRKETNLHHKHLTALKELGDKARMINAVWIMVDGNESQSSCYSGDLSVSESSGNYSIGVSASGCKSSSFSIPAGAVVAYDMVKVSKWDNQELTTKPSCKKNYKISVSKSVTNPKDSCEKTTETDSGVRCQLGALDKRKNWFVSAQSGRDICESKKGKKSKSVECVNKDDRYAKQSGKDKCVSTTVNSSDPFCPAGYEYNKKSTNDGGADVCELRGIQQLKSDVKGS